VVKVISENQKLREKMTIFVRNFEAREQELLAEIHRLAAELSAALALEGDAAPSSIRKMVQNAKLTSQLKNKDMVMNQMLEALKQNKITKH
jgi:hypothetical protein